MLELSHITHYYIKNRRQIPVLEDISLSAKEGSFYIILGPSGCGKTTLLNIAGGLQRPRKGRLTIEGRDYYSLSAGEAASFRSQHMGYIFQQYYLVDDFSLTDNICLAMLRKDLKTKDKKEYAESLLEKVGLAERITWKIKDLSGGEMQRVAIARALANESKYLFCDEPTGSLDQKNSREIMELLHGLSQEGKTVMLVTHDHSFRSLATEIMDFS